jgi:protein PhnA
MWAEANAVKVVAWRMLTKLKEEGWPADLLDMMYMDEETTAWAKEGVETAPTSGVVHRDSNGVLLNVGDSVVLIKDLPVKGSSMIAKRGTPVRNIRLDPNNETYIEGKVEGQTIVIITEYVKKT